MHKWEPLMVLSALEQGPTPGNFRNLVGCIDDIIPKIPALLRNCCCSIELWPSFFLFFP